MSGEELAKTRASMPEGLRTLIMTPSHSIPCVSLCLTFGLIAGAADEPAVGRVLRSDMLADGAVRLRTYVNLVSPVGDFDGDGRTDLAMALDDGAYYLLYGQSDLWGTLIDSVSIRATVPPIRHTLFRTPNDLPTKLALGPAGDVNGDGLDDFVLALGEFVDCGERCSTVSVYEPVLYLILGQQGGLAEEVDVDNLLAACKATKLLRPRQWRGWRRGAVTITPAGDLSGDGLQDLAISPSTTTADGVERAGGVVVLFGSPNIRGRTVDLSDVGIDVPGMFFNGGLPDEKIARIGCIGDFDDDGTSDVAIYCGSGSGFPPRLYLVYGGPHVRGVYTPRTFPAESIGLATWVLLPADIGDLDNDGHSDIVLPFRTSGGTSGSVIVYGGSRRTGTMSDRDFRFGDRAVRLSGEWGSTASGGVDLNDDGIGDFILGSPGLSSEDGTRGAGQIHMVLGRREFPPIVLREDLLKTYGLVVEGSAENEMIGVRQGMVGDLDGDGQGEIYFTGGEYCVSCFQGTYVVPWPLLSGGLDLRVTGVSPNSGGTQGGTTVRIRGSGFGEGMQVYFGDSALDDVDVVNTALLLVTTPRHTAGTVDVRVAKGDESVVIRAGFTYEERFTRVLDVGRLGDEGREFLLSRRGQYFRGATILKDFDGDGRADVALLEATYGGGEPERLHVILHAGSQARTVDLDRPFSGRLIVEATDGLAMRGVLGAGDVNADGLSDIVVKVQDTAGSRPIGLAVVFGRGIDAGGDERVSNEDSLLVWRGDEACASTWASSARVADVDGDGIDDVIALDGIGEACSRGLVIIYGSRSFPAAGRLDVEDWISAKDAGLVSVFDRTIAEVDGGSDLDGDGKPELVLVSLGAVILLRSPERYAGRIILSQASFHGSPCAGLEMTQMPVPMASAALAGDVNGDGYGDIVLGNPDERVDVDPRVGAVRAVSGTIMGEPHCSDIRWWDSYTKVLNGIEVNGRFGRTVKNGGDWDGDGRSEIIVGAPGVEAPGSDSRGSVYVLFGYEDFFAHPIRLDDLRDVGVEFVTAKHGWHLGELISSGQDVNGDGLSDMLVAESSLFPDQAAGGPSAYLIFGRSRYAFVRGDANDDGRIDLGDAVLILNYMFAGGTRPWCLDAADTNDDGNLDVADAIYLLSYLFAQGPAPKEPFTRPGEDPTIDGVACF